MFHFVENDSKVTEASKNLIRTAFKRYSSAKDKDLISKTDFKCAWLYLFGYKISKVCFTYIRGRIAKNISLKPLFLSMNFVSTLRNWAKTTTKMG